MTEKVVSFRPQIAIRQGHARDDHVSIDVAGVVGDNVRVSVHAGAGAVQKRCTVCLRKVGFVLIEIGLPLKKET